MFPSQAGALFLDREDEMAAFQTLLGPDSDAWLLVYHGLRGLGKTTLLERLKASLPADCVPLDLDLGLTTHRENYSGVIRELTQPLRPRIPPAAGEDFRRSRREAEELKKATVKAPILAFRASLIRPTQNIDLGSEVLVQQLEAGRALANAWFDLIDQVEGRLVLFIDHWERLLDSKRQDFALWLVEDLLSRLHDQRPECRVVIASEHRPRRDQLLRQLVNAGEMVSQQVQPLRADHARTLMEGNGLDDGAVQAQILERFGGNPRLIELAVELWHEQPELELADLEHGWDVRATTNWLLQRICDNLTDESVEETAVTRGVVLQSFRFDTLKEVCDLPDLPASWYENFISRSFVQRVPPRPGGKELNRFHRTVRTVGLGYLWQTNLTGFHELHHKALKWYESQVKEE